MSEKMTEPDQEVCESKNYGKMPSDGEKKCCNGGHDHPPAPFTTSHVGSFFCKKQSRIFYP